MDKSYHKTTGQVAGSNVFFKAALAALNDRLPTIPINKNKAATVKWSQFQARTPTTKELESMFSGQDVWGLAAIAGAVSGNLEVLDVDCKYDLTNALFEDLTELFREHLPDVFPRLVVARTVNGGYHLIYRVQGPQVGGNKKLAQRWANAEEQKAGSKVKVLIETRSEGGYFAIAPTPGYSFLQGDLSSIPLITQNDRATLLMIARSFDQMPGDVATPPVRNNGASPGLSPFDAYNEVADIPALLQKHAWTQAFTRGDRIYFKRPGATDKKTSANYHTGLRIFYPFTTSTAFEPDRGYNPTQVYTILEHSGNFSAASRALQKKGFGGRQGATATANPSILEPKPLPEKHVGAPELDEKILPACWRVWLSDTSERLQCPPDYAAVAALVACSSLIGNRIRIKPKQFDSWMVVPNLWGAIVGPPGVMKTPAVNEGLLFFREIAESERRAFETELKKAKFDKEFSDAQRSAIKKKMAKPGANKEDLEREYFNLEVEAPTEKRLWTSDATVEKLGELLNENTNGILNQRDELTGFFRMLDRKGHEQDRAFYLEAWNGEGTFTYDRIGRGKVYIQNLTVSILGTIQPAMIAPYLRSSTDNAGDDGLIQRFQLAVYPEMPAKYNYVDRAPKGRKEARESFKKLYSADPRAIGAKQLLQDAGGYYFLQFDEEAQEFFKEWLIKLETDLRSDTFETPALESHFAKYRSLMPSLAMIFHLLNRVAGKTPDKLIPLSMAELAAAWCGYLGEHAKKLYSMATLSEIEVAKLILERIRVGQIKNEFTARDIYINHWKKLSNPEEVKSGLDALEDYDYLTSCEIRGAGRPKVVYRINESLGVQNV